MATSNKAILNLISSDWAMKEIKLDLSRLKNEVSRFYNEIHARNKSPVERVNGLIRARNHLSNCIMLSKSYFEPEKDGYINNIEDEFGCYKGFTIYLGIANAILDMNQDSLIIAIQNRVDRVETIWISIEKYKYLLLEYMETMIIYSYIRAFNTFKSFNGTKDGQPIIRDLDLFSYFLFMEFYHASEVLGAIARQMILKNQTGKLTSAEDIGKVPPELPSNVKTEEYVPPINNLVSEFSSDPFAEVENV